MPPALMAVGLIQAIEDNDRNRKLVRGVLTFKVSVVTKAETGEAGNPPGQRTGSWVKSG